MTRPHDDGNLGVRVPFEAVLADDATAVTPPKALVPGAVLGRFTLERRLGAGGMAEVWSARLPSGDPVAIKFLYPDHGGDPNLRAMFRDEMHILRRIRHPNVVQVLELGEDVERLWMVMELLDGASLHSLEVKLERVNQRFPLPVVAWIALQVARGLAAVHDARAPDGQSLEVVHRDVAPNNIMVGRDGAVKLVDFGVARARNRLTRTALGVVKGRIGYMAPEQAMGSEVTGQADVFALGVVLWELVAMRRLFPARGTLLQVVQRPEPPSLREFGAPVEIDDLVQQMLALAEEDRPPMAAIEGGLAAWVDAQPGGRTVVQARYRSWVSQILTHGVASRPTTAVVPTEDATPEDGEPPLVPTTADRRPDLPATEVGVLGAGGADGDPTHAMAIIEREAPTRSRSRDPLDEPELDGPITEDSFRPAGAQGFGPTAGLTEAVDLVIPQELSGPHDASVLADLATRARYPGTPTPPMVTQPVHPTVAVVPHPSRPTDRDELARLVRQQKSLRSMVLFLVGLVVIQSVVLFLLLLLR